MAKKKSSSAGFNMSAAIREVLGENRDFSGRETLEAVQQKHPGEAINKGSFGVAFTNARKALGIKGGRRKVVRRQKPGIGSQQSSNGVAVSLEHLQAARAMLTAAGDAETAIRAIKQLQALQI